MDIYFSAMSRKHFELIERLDLKINVLKSYFEIMRSHKFERPECANKYFLDSGAFSAHNQKKDISLSRYISYIKENEDKITIYAGLDSIGCEETTFSNIRKMKKEGLNPLPTWHTGEDVKYLDYYCNNYEYVALGGMVGVSSVALKHFCYTAFSKYPDHKFHGFGVTDTRLIKAFPWHSVDSTTYLNGSKFGHIVHDGTQIHYDKLLHLEKWEELTTYLEKLNSNLSTFKGNAHLKDVFNITQFMKHKNYINKISNAINQTSLF